MSQFLHQSTFQSLCLLYNTVGQIRSLWSQHPTPPVIPHAGQGRRKLAYNFMEHGGGDLEVIPGSDLLRGVQLRTLHCGSNIQLCGPLNLNILLKTGNVHFHSSVYHFELKGALWSSCSVLWVWCQFPWNQDLQSPQTAIGNIPTCQITGKPLQTSILSYLVDGVGPF